MSEKPLPCPFCGSDGEAFTIMSGEDSNVFLTCNCGGGMMSGRESGEGENQDEDDYGLTTEDRRLAIAAWNTRSKATGGTK